MPALDKGWEAVRDGDVYCAPRCGRKCTWDEYTYACDEAATLRALLEEGTGLDWTDRTHENLGWHWSAYLTVHGFGFGQDGMVYISPNVHHTLEERNILTGYTCFFNGPGKQFVVKDTDPVVAFLKAQKEALEWSAKFGTFVRSTMTK